jgi:membrane protease YdiL (CAAX protease family)
MTSRISDWTKQHPLVAYFALAYTITWTVGLWIAASQRGWIGVQVPASAHFLASYGPMLSAFIVTGMTAGAAGIRELVGRMTRWRVGIRWILVALGSPIALYLIAALIMRVWGGAWPDFRRFGAAEELPALAGLAGWAFHTLTFGIGEETGWRGFALPRLQRGRSARSATLILWVFWAIWHLAMFTYKENMMAMGIFQVIGWLVGMLSGAIVLTWLYNSTQGSILMVALWHGTYNATVAATEPLVAAIVSAFVIFGAVVIARAAGEPLPLRQANHLGGPHGNQIHHHHHSTHSG